MNALLIAAFFVGQVGTLDPGSAPRAGSAVLADGTVTANMSYADDIKACWGTGDDVCIDFDATKWCIESSVDGDLVCHTPGSASLDFKTQTKYTIPSTVTVTANAATVDLSDGDLQTLDLQGSSAAVTVTLSNAVTGSWALKIIQGDNGDTITWPGTVMWPASVAPTISAAEDAIDLVTCVYDGANHLCSANQNYGAP